MTVEQTSEDEDFDPLAPVIYADDSRFREVDDEDEFVPAADFGSASPEAELDPEVLDGDGGTSDPDNIVRIWLDEDRQIEKVRVSPQWSTKLQRRRLADVFDLVLALATVDVAPAVEAEPVEYRVDIDPARLPQFSARAFSAIVQLADEVETRLDAAIDRYQARPRLVTPTTEGRSKGVSVVLNSDGVAEHVRFDEAWLETAQAGNICTHVLQAARNAYDKYVPSDDKDRSEIDSLVEEREYYVAVLKMMLNPEERS